MKKHFLIAAISVMTFSSVGIAQQQAPPGRFLIGTDPINFYMSKQTSRNQYSDGGNVESDTSTSTAKTISAHINLFVGYFITKNICAGLQFGNNSTGTYSTFIRYYFNHKRPDSAKLDFFIQANTTFKYTNTDHPYVDNVDNVSYSYNATTDYKSSETTFDFSVGLAAAYHLSRHWALEAEVGYVYGNDIQSNTSYVNTTGTFQPATSIYTTVSNVPALKSVSVSNEAALRFMLTYRL